MNPLRVVFDMDGTIVGYGVGSGPYRSGIQRGLVKQALRMKRAGHQIILWTGATGDHYDLLARHFPDLRIFDEVYTRDELPPFYQDADGEFRSFKDLRRVNGDILFDNDPNHERVAKRLGLDDRRYVTVATYGETGSGNPSSLGGE